MEDLSLEQWESLRLVVTLQVLGGMNLAIARSSEPERELGDLRALWSFGLFDPADGMISRRFLERYLDYLIGPDTDRSDGPTPLLDEPPLAVEQITELIRQHLRYLPPEPTTS